MFGPENLSTLDIVDHLGSVYQAQDKLVEGEELYDRALLGREKVLGLEHTDTLTTVNNLGGLYQAQDKLVEAEAMLNEH